MTPHDLSGLAIGGRPLRVVLTVGTLGLGGTERQVVLLASGLQARGVEVRVLAPYGGGPREDELVRASVPYWVGDVPAKDKPIRLLRSASRFAVEVRRARPDVLHAFLPHAEALSALVGRASGVPALVAGRRSLGTYREGRPALAAAERMTRPAFHAFVANCRAVAEDALAAEPIDPTRMHVIPNALPPSAHLPRRRVALGDPSNVAAVCVANLIAYKGHAVLLDALARLPRPPRLWLVGDGPEREAVEAQAKRLGLSVALLGQRDDVATLLAEADLMIHPSLEEGMSNAVMEGMAAGVPIVATAVGGNAELIDGDGTLCPAGDAAALASAVASVLADPAAARAAAERAARRARTHFSVDALVDQHLALYRRLLSDRRTRGR